MSPNVLFPYLLAVVVLALLVGDWISMRKSAPRAWMLMCVLFVGAVVVSFYQAPIVWFSQVMGIGRAVDAVIYIVTVILIREVFITRAREIVLNQKLTELTRAVAIQNAREVESQL